jgi:ABC-type amino acid transport substrate-binding protein
MNHNPGAPMALSMPRGEPELVRTINNWIDLKQKDRTVERLYGHWMLGGAGKVKKPRWSVVRDVLGRVE